ncbi:RNase H domain-containing protein [Trichonephila clavipes]|nr:RNase H domain-containing protein [Trichonephila clavipes]
MWKEEQDPKRKIDRKNLDSYSVFRSELVAILEGLNSIESLPLLYDIWIFSNSKSALHHLANWRNGRDRRGADILKTLKRLSLSHQTHFQWIPSHVNIAGNEIADSLARAGAGETKHHLPLLLLIWNYFQSIKQRIRPFALFTHGIRANVLAAPWLGSKSPIGFGLLQDEWTHGPDLALLISGMRNNNTTDIACANTSILRLTCLQMKLFEFNYLLMNVLCVYHLRKLRFHLKVEIGFT